jgi:heme-degrading monooxygenase HmoA
MYGSVSRWRVKEGKEDELEKLAAEVMNDRAPGSRAVYMYRADSDPREY